MSIYSYCHKWQEIPKREPDPKTLCAFCQASFTAKYLITGPNDLNICLDCVSLCTEIKAEREARLREDAVTEMLAIAQSMEDAYQPSSLMYQLYDAGYRKVGE